MTKMKVREPTPLPPTPHLSLVKLNVMQVAELIERRVNFVDGNGRSVHLPTSFVQHFKRRDDELPHCYGICQLPIVLPEGNVLSGRELHRESSTLFLVPKQLDAVMPAIEACDDRAVAEALAFLVDEWLVDVAAADFASKCVIVAVAMTIIERLLLPERPCFFVVAGQRGSGKTTTLHMVSQAVLGTGAVASGWSPSEEERRKALFSYLGDGLPLLTWDNLKRGSTISCPSIEKSLTTEFYADRVLGISETRRVPAYTVQCFTGNNITPRGDLASRALVARLGADRPDPENRHFTHPDPIAWTLLHRGSILQAMYTIMLGNPRRRAGEHDEPKTRFKLWWDMIGSAIEHAARLNDESVRFEQLFLSNDEQDAETTGLAEVLDILDRFWQDGFKAADVAKALNGGTEMHEDRRARLRVGLEAGGKLLPPEVSPSIITWRLKTMVDAPTQFEEDVLVLRCKHDRKRGDFFVVELCDPNEGGK
jgi:hypothetical protein